MIGALIATAALLMFVNDASEKPKTRTVIYVYEHIVSEDQPIPFTVTDSIVVKEEIVP